MRTILLSAFAFGVVTTAVLAGPATPTPTLPSPTKLTDAQMDTITAGDHGSRHGAGGNFGTSIRGGGHGALDDGGSPVGGGSGGTNLGSQCGFGGGFGKGGSGGGGSC
jgi:hypothetical protein